MSLFEETRRPEEASLATRDLLRLGLVQSVDLAAARCVVDLGDGLISGTVPWAAARAGGIKVWLPPSAGEQVLVYAPEGDLERAICGPALFFNGGPAPAADGRALIEFPDGAFVAWETGGRLDVSAIADVRIAAPDILIVGKLTVQGDVDVQGGVAVEGDVAAEGDVTADKISLKTHKHLGVAVGPGVSGQPQVPPS